jgi:hypothetical protein
MNIVAKRTVYIPPSSGTSNNCQATGQNPYPGCPNSSITRDEAAQWIIRAIFGNDNFAYGTTPYFSDVGTGNAFFPWIQALYELGITSGCGPGAYCPTNNITRAQIAVMLMAARFGKNPTSFDYPTQPYFTDVPSSHWAFPWIQRMRYDNVTAGCGDGTRYCPDSNVTRGDLSAYIDVALLNTLLPSTAPQLTRAYPLTAVGGTTVTFTITGRNTKFRSPGPAQVTLLGCTYQPVSNPLCLSRQYTPAPPISVTAISDTQLNVQLTLNSIGMYIPAPPPQSFLVSYPITGSPLDNGMQELVMPNTVRVTNQQYSNIALPGSPSGIPGNANSGWTQIMLAGQPVVSFSHIDKDQPSSYWHAPTIAPFFASYFDLSTTPRPPTPNAQFPNVLLFSDFQPTNNEIVIYDCPLDQQTNYDATHPVFYQAAQFHYWPHNSAKGSADYMQSTCMDGDLNSVPINGLNLFSPVAGVKGLLFRGSFKGSTGSFSGPNHLRGGLLH